MKELDFAGKALRDKLATGRTMLIDAYRFLHDELGAERPADNGFLREAVICARQRLIQVNDRHSVDARSAKTGEKYEIKTTRLDNPGRKIDFPTSRNIGPEVIKQFQSADWWLFGVFDAYEQMIALYRVPKNGMKPTVKDLEQRMKDAVAAGKRELNNVKISLTTVKTAAGAETIFFDKKKYTESTSNSAAKHATIREKSSKKA